MALDKVKTKSSAGSGTGKSRWTHREFAKVAARKRRRREDVKAAREG